MEISLIAIKLMSSGIRLIGSGSALALMIAAVDNIGRET